jgi:membrane protein DedA with SNARE-associated domain
VGHWALAFGYFIVGVRHVTAIVAGMSKLQFRSFALYAWSGGAVWVLSFILLGYTFGEQWRSIEELVRRDMVYASLGLLAAAALALIARQILRRRRLASAQVPGPSRN